MQFHGQETKAARDVPLRVCDCVCAYIFKIEDPASQPKLMLPKSDRM